MPPSPARSRRRYRLWAARAVRAHGPRREVALHASQQLPVGHHPFQPPAGVVGVVQHPPRPVPTAHDPPAPVEVDCRAGVRWLGWCVVGVLRGGGVWCVCHKTVAVAPWPLIWTAGRVSDSPESGLSGCLSCCSVLLLDLVGRPVPQGGVESFLIVCSSSIQEAISRMALLLVGYTI